jgi:pimeloyl-ACP methyl ester carboxylesterase/DNA-binding winged helix-turn-helix (wHTH) protein
LDQTVRPAGALLVLLPGFTIDLAREEIRTVRGAHVVLRPRSFAVLRLLASNLGGLVTKDEIISRVWDDVSVTEDSLTQCIADIRRALGDKERRIVRTVPRRGYMLVGDAAPADVTTSPSQPAHNLVEAAKPSALVARPAQSMPETLYAKSGNVHIAYQVIGKGPPDLVFVQGYITHLEIEWEDPRPASFYKRLASFCRLVRFDRRGMGLSDRVGTPPTLEERMDDVRAVMDAVGSTRAVLLGSSEGGPMSMLFCATYPQRVSALVLYGSMARASWAPDNPWGRTAEQQAAILRDMQEKWGQGHSVDRFAPSLAGNPEYRRWRGRVDRSGAAPGAAVALTQLNFQVDVRHVLPSISVPTLVIHKTHDAAVRVEHGRYIARHIDNAKYVELPGQDHAPWLGSAKAVCDEIQAFTRWAPDVPRNDRVLATILFADVANAPAEIGHGAWGGPIARYRVIVDQQVEQHRGRRLEATGYALLAAFDGPARAVRCGLAIVDAVRNIGLQMRAGIHIGECDVVGDKLGGVAVRIGMRLAASAAPGEVLVSSTVRDVVAGSGLGFEERGVHVLDEVPGTWTLLAAVQGG